MLAGQPGPQGEGSQKVEVTSDNTWGRRLCFLDATHAGDQTPQRARFCSRR